MAVVIDPSGAQTLQGRCGRLGGRREPPSEPVL